MKPLATVFLAGIAAMITAMITGCSTEKPPSVLAAKIKRFAPTPVAAELSNLSPGDRRALVKLAEAAQIIDRIYARQIWSGNQTLRVKLEADWTAEGVERLHYYNINRSPWSNLDHDEPFVAGVPNVKPPCANYYPEDMTKQAFNAWVGTLSEAGKHEATGFFTTIRRDALRQLKAVPYSEEYRDLLVPAAGLLRGAADLTDNASLRNFLTKRADAFLSNDYYESDVAWMDLDSPIEPTIGPYEVYLDGLFNYKAAFEAYICIRDDSSTAKLAFFSAHLQEIEDALPINPRYRNPKLGALSPIRVADEVMTGGEAREAVQTAAFNLPNDERVTAAKGSKRVMLKNVQEAKFMKILKPIARIAIDPTQQSSVAFDPFFTHILAHELMHGLGPHTIMLGGKQTTVRQAMQELSSAIEEAKADISGLFALQYMIDHGLIAKSMEKQMYITYLAGIFRSVRFGINEAHGQGMAMQLNYLMDEGAIVYNEATGLFSADIEKFKAGATRLTGEIMTIQAEGNYDRAKGLLNRYAVIRPSLQRTLDRLARLPVDIEPQFADLSQP
ncbi:MAG TPA: hypothetical protein VF514_15060 [Bacteroidota bacterium]